MEKDDTVYLSNLEHIALLIDGQTYDERMEFSRWFANLEEYNAEYISSALSAFSEEYNYLAAAAEQGIEID